MYRFQIIKQKYSLNPHNKLDAKDNPLSQSKQSIWNQHFCDKELCAVIKQDVVRTYPGVDFFRKPFIQETMTDILFCYARENPKMCYRQVSVQITINKWWNVGPTLAKIFIHGQQNCFLVFIYFLHSGHAWNISAGFVCYALWSSSCLAYSRHCTRF